VGLGAGLFVKVGRGLGARVGATLGASVGCGDVVGLGLASAEGCALGCGPLVAGAGTSDLGAIEFTALPPPPQPAIASAAALAKAAAKTITEHDLLFGTGTAYEAGLATIELARREAAKPSSQISKSRLACLHCRA